VNDSSTSAAQWWKSSSELVTTSFREFRQQAVDEFCRIGASTADATFVTDIYLDKALQGDHARGLRMLLAEIKAARRGEIVFNTTPKLMREMGATALVDAEFKASSKLVCRFAMDLAIRKAREQGVGLVSARARAEILTPYVQQAASVGMIGFVMAQSIPTVAPHGGIKPLLGNAPIAWGIPAKSHDPIILDTCLTQTSGSGVALAAEHSETVPEGFILNKLGQASTNPADLYDPAWFARGRHVALGSLLPVGASHKSYAQIFITGLLTSILAQADFAWNLANNLEAPGRFGALFLVANPAAFGSDDSFLLRVDEYIEQLKASPRRNGVERILYPGERSQELKRALRKSDRLDLPCDDYRNWLTLMADVGNC
jgi:L-2-hydroxycarboxylate dehydrogenase (NAD+)